MHVSVESLTSMILMNNLSHRSTEMSTSNRVFEPTTAARLPSTSDKTEWFMSTKTSTRYCIQFLDLDKSIACMNACIHPVFN